MLLTGIVAMQLAVLWGATLRCSRPGRAGACPAARSRPPASRCWSLWVGPGGRRRRSSAPRGSGPFPTLGLLLSRGGVRAGRARRVAHLELVSPHHGRGADPRAVPGVPVPDAAALPVDELLRRARDARADRHGVRRPGAESRPDAAALRRAGAAARSTPSRGAARSRQRRGPPTAPRRIPTRRFSSGSRPLLARERLTSAVELYDRNGKLVSRFALNFPEYTATARAEQRRLRLGRVRRGRAVRLRGAPHAARRAAHLRRSTPPACGLAAGRHRPARAASTTRRCRSSPRRARTSRWFGPRAPARQEGTAGGNVEVAIYGWGLQPIYTSGRSAWPITDAAVRAALRARASRSGRRRKPAASGTEVYFSNDRERIYAIGYPVLTPVRSPRPPRRADDARRRGHSCSC